jgi:hypothetical protein
MAVTGGEGEAVVVETPRRERILYGAKTFFTGMLSAQVRA